MASHHFLVDAKIDVEVEKRKRAPHRHFALEELEDKERIVKLARIKGVDAERP